ncbi:ThiF family adenylyltransferase [Niabella hirudinis]|uniref:ThiF family adenylyltransferase n=1 Tax=Niabella hirudinis TaxID=1285929 RepID=UPI003EB84951
MEKNATANDSALLQASDGVYKPLFFRIYKEEDRQLFLKLQETVKDLVIYDQILSQLHEYVKICYLTKLKPGDDLQPFVNGLLGNRTQEEYGVWVYYPWSKRLVHLLDEEEFVALRTSRNTYKITPEERELLRSKKIGVIGLSVGQSIAITLAMERVCGALHLADFDKIELSNMNRLNVGVQDIGLNKAVLAARKIAELDPFLDVLCFEEGITAQNLDAFFLENGKIDILVEECDGIDVKISSRLKARELGVPVVMDTNDRGMLDIERFDLEPGRAIFHGSIDEGMNTEKLKGLTNEEKIVILGKIFDLSKISGRMKHSLGEMNKTINAWPQLASSVVLGGAMVTDTCRRILLSEIHRSGRYYIDFNDLIN